ncbi:MAG: cysteine desulfurase family protein [Salaquimonas sp.]
MAQNRTYLDYNASAPLLPCAREAMFDALNCVGNPSSVHYEGRQAKKMLEEARAALGKAISASGNQIVFTSGASEAATHVLSPIIRAGGREVEISRLYLSAVEHPCILAGGRFAKEQISHLPVTEAGLVQLPVLEAMLKAHDHAKGAPMVAVMLANNETGTLQPIAEIAELVHAHDGFLVVDAVQAFGKVELDVSTLSAHFVILSSHKIGGPKGAGAVIFGDASISPQPMILGGGQENFQRGGTENLAAIAGFGAAAAQMSGAMDKISDISIVRDSIEAGVSTICSLAGNKAGPPVFFGKNSERLPNTSCFAVPGVKAETALISLDLAGIAVSSGSACSSGKVRKSHVLEAMGVDDDLAACALRVSTGATTTNEDAERFLGAFKDIVSRVA